MDFIIFMNERRNVDRWFILKVGLSSAFSGALLTTAFMIVGLA